MPINAERLPTTAWLGGQPVTRSEILAWEARRAAKALQRLGGLLPEGDVEPRREAVVEAKLALGRAGIERRLEREVRLSDRATGVVARLSGTRRRVCQVGIFVAGRAVAERLPAWYMERAEANDEAAFLAACPDHHIFRLTPDGRQEVWETTGGSPLASRFFFTFGETDTVVTPADPSYPFQMTGTARLADGTTLGGIRHQFREEAEGTRALLTVEFPWLMPQASIAAHRWHVACEFSQWVEAAAASAH